MTKDLIVMTVIIAFIRFRDASLTLSMTQLGTFSVVSDVLFASFFLICYNSQKMGVVKIAKTSSRTM